MSSNRLIQFLDTTLGDGSAITSPVSNRREVETFIAGGAITAGDWVAFDSTKTGQARAATVIECPGVATKGNPRAFGVSLETVAADELVKVVTAGYVEGASVAGATIAGTPLVGPIGTAGRAEVEAPGTTTGSVCGIALEADTANFADVMVIKQF